MNFAQSSRNAISLNTSIFNNNISSVKEAGKFYAAKNITESGNTDIQLKQKQPANTMHYIIGAGIIIGLIYYASKQME